MRGLLATVLVAGFLAGCSTEIPNDQDQYFDNITPDPAALQIERQRLSDTETGGETVQLPVDAAGNTLPAPVVGTENAAISNTQDFKVVKEQETIASDAAKLAALRQSYQIIEPEPLPQRKDDTNLPAYALSQKQAIGKKTYSRSNNSQSGCGRYRNDPDGAQRAFLEAGGPQKDRRNLDSDGDGFACSWNPNAYRSLLQN